MNPRHADVAFVLDSIRGVRALYAIDPGRPAGAHFDFAVELEYGGRTLAEVHYALLRVMSHDDCARVCLCVVRVPPSIAEAGRLLRLTESDRETANHRVAAYVPVAPIVVPPPPPAEPSVLVVDGDPHVQAVVGETVGKPALWAVATGVEAAVELVAERSFDLILCDARLAFGLDGLLAMLPIAAASRVLVLVTQAEIADARWRLDGNQRIVRKPLEGWILRNRINNASVARPLSAPDVQRAVVADKPRRRIASPPPPAPFSVLLADVDDDVHDSLRRIFREEARHVMRQDPQDGAEMALTTPFHVIVCSAKAALHPRSILDGIAREDHAGADQVLVIAPSRDVPYVKHRLEQMGRKNRVLALPIDDTTLRREVFRDHPTLAAREAVAEVASAEAPSFPLVRFRRLAVLVVDDDQTTQILFAAAESHGGADVTLAASPMDAFEHVLSRPVDVLIVSATMRGDGGEPFYRVLWRMKPELKSRCVLVLAPGAVPASSPQSNLPRILERPLTREAIARTVDAFARR